MKLFLLCGVLIYGIVLCSNVVSADDSKSTEEGDSSEEFNECTAQYLKSKGLIEYEVPSSKRSSMCIFALEIAVRAIREIFETKLEMDMPNDAKCVMDEFDKKGVYDLLMRIAYVTGNKAASEDEKKASLAAFDVEGDKMMADIAKACNVDEEKLGSFMETSFDDFDSSEEKTATAAA